MAVERETEFLTALDLVGDELPDLVTVNARSDSVSIVLNERSGGIEDAVRFRIEGRANSLPGNDGTGTFRASTKSSIGTARRSLSLLSADLNAEDAVDLALVNGAFSSIALLFNVDLGESLLAFVAPVQYRAEGRPHTAVPV